jgi:hypothetical protein
MAAARLHIDLNKGVPIFGRIMRKRLSILISNIHKNKIHIQTHTHSLTSAYTCTNTNKFTTITNTRAKSDLQYFHSIAKVLFSEELFHVIIWHIIIGSISKIFLIKRVNALKWNPKLMSFSTCVRFKSFNSSRDVASRDCLRALELVDNIDGPEATDAWPEPTRKRS